MWADTQGDLDCENDRQTMARLLHIRGEDLAAAIVAVSSYQDILVDNWDGGQYESELAVPPEVYDQARSECAEALDRACSDLIGAERYRGLNITLKRTAVDPEWIAQILAALRPQWVPSERADGAALGPAAT
jgi:hypothetical protein